MSDFDWDKDSVPAEKADDFDWERDSTPVASEPGLLDQVAGYYTLGAVGDKGAGRSGAAALLGTAQGLTFGHADEIVGGLKAIPRAFGGENLEQAYLSARDDERELHRVAQADSPTAYGVGDVVGSVAVPMPGPGKVTGAAKVGRMVGLGAGAGALSGMGRSDAEDAGGLAADMAGMAAMGGAAGGVAAGAGLAFDKARGALRGVAGRAAGEVADAADDAFRHDQAVARGEMGPKVAEMRKNVRDLRALQQQGNLSRDQAVELFRLEDKLAAEEQLMARDAMKYVRGYERPQYVEPRSAEDRAADMLAGGGAKLRGILGKAGLALAGGAIGGALGGLPGAAIGVAAGAGGGALGAAGRAIARDPSARHAAASTLERVIAQPQRFGKYAAPLLDAASRGQQAFDVVDFTLQQQDPEYRALLSEDEP